MTYGKTQREEYAVIVLHSCDTSTFAELLSKSDKFENVLIIGPNKNVRVYYSKLRKIGNLKDGNSLYLARYNSTAVQTLNPRTKKLEQGGLDRL